MTFEVYKGGRGRGRAFVAISPDGVAYISAALARELRAKAGAVQWVQVVYEAVTRRLGFRACGDCAAGTRRLSDNKGAVRIQGAEPLRYFGIMPDERTVLDATVERDPQTRAWQIVATLPAPGGQSPPGPPGRAAPEPPEAEIAAELDAAIDYEDDFDPDDALTALPLKGERRICETCTFRRTGLCMNPQSRHANLDVGAGESCDLFVRRKLFAPPPAKKDVYRPKARPRAAVVHKRPRVLCSVCRTEHAASGDGRPYTHDVDGVEYRGGHGDRDRRCPGSDKPGTKI